MKVISAGYSKTGTKTMNAALTELGYNVYDYAEHFFYHGEEWKKILEKGPTTDGFRRMYEGVDAVVDGPAFTFWRDIHHAFSDAKIILTLRDEDSWFQSLTQQFDPSGFTLYPGLLFGLTPTGKGFVENIKKFGEVAFGLKFHNFSKNPWILNETIAKLRFRQHNADVMQNAPNDKLLVYNVKEGWKPLCEFLGKDVPDKPFPYKNKHGNTDIHEEMLEHPFGKQMKKELLPWSIFHLVVLGAAGFGMYKLYKHVPWYSCAEKLNISRFLPKF